MIVFALQTWQPTKCELSLTGKGSASHAGKSQFRDAGIVNDLPTSYGILATFCAAVAVPCCRRRGHPALVQRINGRSKRFCVVTPNCAADAVRKAGMEGGSSGLSGAEVLSALVALETSVQNREGGLSPLDAARVQGRYELIFSGWLANVPILDGYMPTRETLEFSFGSSGEMNLEVETLPFLPSIKIVGEDCALDAAAGRVSYTIRGKSERSTWTILFVDDDILAARSSVTGLNIARRLSSGLTAPTGFGGGESNK